MRRVCALFFLLTLAARADVAIEIDLSAQKAWVLQDGQRVYETPISSGRSLPLTIARCCFALSRS